MPLILLPVWVRARHVSRCYSECFRCAIALVLLLTGSSSAVLADTNEALLEAISTADVEAAKLALSQGADVNARNLHGVTALALASSEQNRTLVELLLARRADPNRFGQAAIKRQQSPLYWAVVHGQQDIANVLLENGARPEINFDHGGSPLQLAVKLGDTAMIDLLLKHGADLNSQDIDGNTAVHAWITGPSDETFLGELLKREVGVDARNSAGYTALMQAAYLNVLEKVLALIEVGADVDLRNGAGQTALALAAASIANDIRLFSVRDEIGKGALGVVRALIAAGADTDLADKTGTTPLMLAAAKAPPQVVETLLAAGADPNGVDDQRQTALFYAVFGGRPESVALLLDAGADPTLLDQNGKTPVAHAREIGNAGVLAVFKVDRSVSP